MKKAFLMILGLGIVCSQLLSQESAIRKHFTDQPKETEATPDGSASRSAIGLNISDFGTSEGIDTERNRIRTSRLVSGLGLAVSWVGTVIGDLLYEDGYRQYTLIPVIGPWITLAKLGSDPGWTGAKPLLILSGVAQAGFATYFIISLTRQPKPRETKNVAIWTNFNSINLRIQF